MLGTMQNAKVDFSELEGMPSLVDSGGESWFDIFLSLVVFSSLFLVIGFKLGDNFGPNFFATTVLFSVFVWIIALPMAYLKLEKDKKINIAQQKIQAFAKANNFQFFEEATQSSVEQKGSLFDVLVTYGMPTNIIEGKLGEYDMQLMDYEYFINKREYKLRIMRLGLKQKMPHMVIDCLVEDGDSGGVGPGDHLYSTLPINFDTSQKIELEGDFYKFFSLYAPDKQAVNLLSIIGPDTMEVLMKMKSLCDIEIIDKYIYFYWPDETVSKKNYRSIFETAQSVMSEIGKKLNTINLSSYASSSQVVAMPKDKLNKKSLLSFNRKEIPLMLFIISIPLPMLALFFGASLPLIVLALLGILLSVFSGVVYVVYEKRKTQKLANSLKSRFNK